MTPLDRNKNVTLVHVKQKKSDTKLSKEFWNYQKNFGKSKSQMEHQNLQGKLSEYAVFTVHTVSTAIYV